MCGEKHGPRRARNRSARRARETAARRCGPFRSTPASSRTPGYLAVPSCVRHRRSSRSNEGGTVMRTSACAALALLALVAATRPAGARTAGDPTPTPTVYRLNQGSTYEQGCFGPCLCPVLIDAPVKGTFALTPTGSDGLFNTYAVTDVNWVVPIDGTDTIVSGSGTYRIGGEFALQQQLSLDLQVGGEKAEHFDSGVVTYKIVGQSAAQQELSLLLRVGDEEPLHLESGLGPVGGNFPAIDLRISVSDATCYDTVIEVHAQPYKRPH